MARMSIDDKFLRDTRVRRLGAHLGWSRRETMGCLLDVFAITYDRETHLIPAADIDEAAGKQCFAEALVSFDLAEHVGDLVRVKGAYERVEYLVKKREAGRIGGRKSGESRRNKREAKRSTSLSTTSRSTEARGNPPDPVPDPAPDPVPEISADQISGEDLGSSAEKKVVVTGVTTLFPVHPTRKRPKPSEPSPTESASIATVLAKLSAASGVQLRGAQAHVRLILARLREGITELELRAVVAYCADEWKADPKMQRYLRPETLFGPETIARYLDPARTLYRDRMAEAARDEGKTVPQTQHTLEIVR